MENIKKAIQLNDDLLLIKAIINVYVNDEVDESYDNILYKIFIRAMDYFDQGKLDDFMQLSEVACNLALAVDTVQAKRLYFEMQSATSYLMSDHERTIEILEAYEAYCIKYGYSEYLQFIIGNKATMEIELERIEDAKKTLEKVKEIANGEPSTVYYVNMARVKILEKETEGLLEDLNKAISSKELKDNYINQVEVYLYFAKYYLLIDNKDLSLSWYKKTIALIENYEIAFEERRVYKELAGILEKLKMYPESNFYLKKYSDLLESAVKKERQLMSSKSKLQKYINEKEIENRLLRREKDEVTELSNRDFLTGIYNRRYMSEYLNLLLEDKILDFHVLIFDIDAFKAINDTYGHITGDYIIRQVSILVDDLIKEHFIARTGGDEFIVIFDRLSQSEASVLANHIKNTLSDHIFKYDGHEIKLTISGGMRSVYTFINPTEILRDADVLLYRSKRNGKNQISQ